MKPDRLGARAVHVKMVLLFRPWFTQGEGLCPGLTDEAEGEMDFSRYVSTPLFLSPSSSSAHFCSSDLKNIL